MYIIVFEEKNEFGMVITENDHHEHYRQKRATCNLLSWFGVNHSACAAHCIAKRFKGGRCGNRAVCKCRR